MNPVAVSGRTVQIGDLVISSHANSLGYQGRVTAVASQTSVTVAYVASISGPAGPQGATGAAGAAGATGQGVPTGGTTGQVLTKTSATNYATNWQTPAAAAGRIIAGGPLLGPAPPAAAAFYSYAEYRAGVTDGSGGVNIGMPAFPNGLLTAQVTNAKADSPQHVVIDRRYTSLSNLVVFLFYPNGAPYIGQSFELCTLVTGW